jgi:multicomponent Na+:H+ antiporter subunit E
MTAAPSKPARSALRIGAGVALMMAVWLLWSGYFKPLLISLGFVSCCIVMLLSWRMGNLEQESVWQRRLLRFPRYWLWLGWEVVKSNLEVARVILSPRPTVSPRLVTIDAESTDEFAQAMLGNSITLTPGTLTLGIEQGRLRVHCLTREGAVALAQGEMNRRVAALMRS